MEMRGKKSKNPPTEFAKETPFAWSASCRYFCVQPEMFQRNLQKEQSNDSQKERAQHSERCSDRVVYFGREAHGVSGS